MYSRIYSLIDVMLASPGTPKSQTVYGYDLLGNLASTAVNDNTAGSNHSLTTYQYDKLNRLTNLHQNLHQSWSSTSGGKIGVVADYEYSYDLFNERVKSEEFDGTTTSTYDWVYDNLVRLTQESFDYGANGHKTAEKDYLAKYEFDLVGNHARKTIVEGEIRKADEVTIHASKTEHHEGQGIRVMPLFPELRPYLQIVLDELLVDFDPKAKRLSEQPVITRYRASNVNLRMQLQKIIARAGLKPWTKLFQNLRTTRATELADEFPAHVAAAWLGHTTAVADKHYRQTTDAHFARAIGQAAQPVQNPVHEGGQNETQEGAPRRSGENVENALNQQSSDFRDADSYCVPLRPGAVERVGDAGLEPATFWV